MGLGTSIEADYFIGHILPLSEKSFIDLNYASANSPGAFKEAKANFAELAAIYHHTDAFITGDHARFGTFYSSKFTIDSGKELHVEASYLFPINTLLNVTAGLGYSQLENNESFWYGHKKKLLGLQDRNPKGILGLSNELMWIDNTLDLDADIASGNLVFSIGLLPVS